MAYWQVIQAGRLSLQADRQRASRLELFPTRGEILASDGMKIVTNKDGYLLIINPELTPWRSLTDLFPNLIKPPQVKWFPVAHQVTTEIKSTVEKRKLPGISWENETYRWYPEASASAHLLGFVGQDENGNPKGYFGLEGYYDRELTGRLGRTNQEIDALFRPILLVQPFQLDSQDGQTLSLSINRSLQHLVYQKLQKGLETYQAKSGTVTVMEPSTGRILAMVSLPNYDPAQYTDFDQVAFKNPVITDAFEPGSTFKTIIMAAALDAGVVKPETLCDICYGPVRVSDYVIKTWNDQYHPNSTMTDVLVHSDNVGMVFVSRKLGTKLLHYLHNFGFGQETGIDLQEEIVAPLRSEKDWHEIDYATASFGQGIAVTPIQLLQAVAAIANRGILVQPRVVDKISDRVVNSPKGRSVISQFAAAMLTQMMVKSVDAGEAKWAKPKGFVIAGKTGTAQIPVSGHYDKNKTIASFVGFAPADNPHFAMLVTLREPQTSPWGSETAAPLWFDIAREIFRLGI